MNNDAQLIWEAYAGKMPIGGQSHKTLAEALQQAAIEENYSEAAKIWSSLDGDGRVMVAKHIRHKHGLQYWDDVIKPAIIKGNPQSH